MQNFMLIIPAKYCSTQLYHSKLVGISLVVVIVVAGMKGYNF